MRQPHAAAVELPTSTTTSSGGFLWFVRRNAATTYKCIKPHAEAKELYLNRTSSVSLLSFGEVVRMSKKFLCLNPSVWGLNHEGRRHRNVMSRDSKHFIRRQEKHWRLRYISCDKRYISYDAANDCYNVDDFWVSGNASV